MRLASQSAKKSVKFLVALLYAMILHLFVFVPIAQADSEISTTSEALADAIPNNAEKLAKFHLRTNAHRYRLLVRVEDALSDVNFLERFPEFKSLAKQKPSALRVTLGHDLQKLTNADYVKVLAEYQEVDHRGSELDPQVSAKIKKAIEELNSVDGPSELAKIKAQFQSSSDVKLMQKLLLILDKHDSYARRGKELGKPATMPTSEWLVKIEQLEPRESNSIEIAKYFEAKEKDVGKLLAHVDSEWMRGNNFDSLAKKFLNKANFNPKALLSGAGKVVGGVMVGVEAARVLHDPKENLLNNVLGNFTTTSDTAEFTSWQSKAFIEECQKKFQAQYSLEKCAADFFAKSLIEQNQFLEKMSFDTDLLNLLTQQGGWLNSLSCSNDEASKSIEFTIGLGHMGRQTQTQKMLLSHKGAPAKIQIQDERNPETKEAIFFEQGKAKFIQMCSPLYGPVHVGGNCQNTSALVVEKIIGDKAKRSYHVLKFLRMQEDNLQKCCAETNCRNYFAAKKSAESARDKLTAERRVGVN